MKKMIPVITAIVLIVVVVAIGFVGKYWTSIPIQRKSRFAGVF